VESSLNIAQTNFPTTGFWRRRRHIIRTIPELNLCKAIPAVNDITASQGTLKGHWGIGVMSDCWVPNCDRFFCRIASDWCKRLGSCRILYQLWSWQFANASGSCRILYQTLSPKHRGQVSLSNKWIFQLPKHRGQVSLSNKWIFQLPDSDAAASGVSCSSWWFFFPIPTTRFRRLGLAPLPTTESCIPNPFFEASETCSWFHRRVRNTW
jgi:hypothetical protein